MQVSLASNGQEAVDAFQRIAAAARSDLVSVRQSGDTPLDLILMDVDMPVLNGLDATRAIRGIEADKAATEAHVRRTPIVAITAFASSTARESCFEAGMDDYITKPFALADLRQKISVHVQIDAERSHDRGSGSSGQDPAQAGAAQDAGRPGAVVDGRYAPRKSFVSNTSSGRMSPVLTTEVDLTGTVEQRTWALEPLGAGDTAEEMVHTAVAAPAAAPEKAKAEPRSAHAPLVLRPAAQAVLEGVVAKQVVNVAQMNAVYSGAAAPELGPGSRAAALTLPFPPPGRPHCRSAGNEQLMANSVSMYLRMAQHVPEQIDEAIAASDVKKLHTIVHQCKGSAGYIGGERLHGVAECLQRTIEEHLPGLTAVDGAAGEGPGIPWPEAILDGVEALAVSLEELVAHLSSSTYRTSTLPGA